MARVCRLGEAVGEHDECSTGRCAFWEPGGAVLAGRCAFERLDLEGREALAAELLAVRRTLEQAGDGGESQLRHLFHRLLNDDPE